MSTKAGVERVKLVWQASDCDVSAGWREASWGSTTRPMWDLVCCAYDSDEPVDDETTNRTAPELLPDVFHPGEDVALDVCAEPIEGWSAEITCDTEGFYRATVRTPASEAVSVPITGALRRLLRTFPGGRVYVRRAP